MQAEERHEKAAQLMLAFAERTGLGSSKLPQRYLWTDAFAVCNLLGLAEATGQKRYAELARKLVEQVHATLGKHRADDPRTGWLSGDAEHPTRAGLRIGKPLPERAEGAAFDRQQEWDRDGQYFHYLTRWMHALDQLARSTREAKYSVWARELGSTAYDAFTYSPTELGGRRMYWKMSIDLSRPLVASMGQHDPLDGYVTFQELEATAESLHAGGPSLDDEARGFGRMLGDRDFATSDPLGIGGLLMDAYRMKQLIDAGSVDDRALLAEMLAGARAGTQHFATLGELDEPASRRLGFRELGLAIGLAAVERMMGEPPSGEARKHLVALERYVPLRRAIEAFWLEPENQRSPTWTEHRDINEVMLATSLAPEGCLVLR